MEDNSFAMLGLLAVFLLVAGVVLAGRDWLEELRERNAAPIGRFERAEPRAFAQRTWRWATCPHADGFTESGDDFIRNLARCRYCGWVVSGPAGRVWPMPPGSSSTWPRPGAGDVAQFVRMVPNVTRDALLYEALTTTDEGVRRWGLPIFHEDVYGDLDPRGDQERYLEAQGTELGEAVARDRGLLARRAGSGR
jgi:hypothetical protein